MVCIYPVYCNSLVLFILYLYTTRIHHWPDIIYFLFVSYLFDSEHPDTPAPQHPDTLTPWGDSHPDTLTP